MGREHQATGGEMIPGVEVLDAMDREDGGEERDGGRRDPIEVRRSA